MLWAKVKSLVPVLENRYFYLKYLILKGAGKVCWKVCLSTSRMMVLCWPRGRNRVVGAGSCAVQYVSLGAGSDAVTDRCSALLSLGMSAGNQTRGQSPFPLFPGLAPHCCRQVRGACTVALIFLAIWRTALSKVTNLALFPGINLSQNLSCFLRKNFPFKCLTNRKKA